MRIAIAVVGLTLTLSAQADFADVDKLFQDFASANHVPGAAWGIVIDGKLVHAGATGYRDLETKSAPNADTVFRIASMTKSFTAMSILGRIVGRVSGVPYADYVAANILRPLGMMSTTLEPSSVPADRLAHGYRWEDNQWKEERQLPHGAGGAMGGMLTSINDLSKYVSAHLSAWPPHDGPETAPIRRASLREMQQMWRPAGVTVTRGAAGAIQLNAGGYAFGLRVSQTCNFNYIVSHTGGLPGFGSIMQWLPEYGAGVIAFGNVTYTAWGRVVANVFDALAKDRRIKPRAVAPSKALTDARDAVSQLVIKWDDALADRIAAENLFLDQSKDRRRAAIAEFRSRVGACTPPKDFDYVENALRGRWTVTCERGNLQVAITLAPTMPPKVQLMGIRPAMPVTMENCQ